MLVLVSCSAELLLTCAQPPTIKASNAAAPADKIIVRFMSVTVDARRTVCKPSDEPFIHLFGIGRGPIPFSRTQPRFSICDLRFTRGRCFGRATRYSQVPEVLELTS